MISSSERMRWVPSYLLSTSPALTLVPRTLLFHDAARPSSRGGREKCPVALGSGGHGDFRRVHDVPEDRVRESARRTRAKQAGEL
jgi:hypothetical protein